LLKPVDRSVTGSKRVGWGVEMVVDGKLLTKPNKKSIGYLKKEIKQEKKIPKTQMTVYTVVWA